MAADDWGDAGASRGVAVRVVGAPGPGPGAGAAALATPAAGVDGGGPVAGSRAIAEAPFGAATLAGGTRISNSRMRRSR
jgi:hypothetical protein